MIGTKFTLENADGQSIIINDHDTDPLNCIALQEYPTFELEIKNQEIAKEGQQYGILIAFMERGLLFLAV